MNRLVFLIPIIFLGLWSCSEKSDEALDKAISIGEQVKARADSLQTLADNQVRTISVLNDSIFKLNIRVYSLESDNTLLRLKKFNSVLDKLNQEENKKEKSKAKPSAISSSVVTDTTKNKKQFLDSKPPVVPDSTLSPSSSITSSFIDDMAEKRNRVEP